MPCGVCVKERERERELVGLMKNEAKGSKQLEGLHLLL